MLPNEIVKEMLANPLDLYRRVSDGFAVSAGEAHQLRNLLRLYATQLRSIADEIDKAVATEQPVAIQWYETISAERDIARKVLPPEPPE